MSIYSQKAVPIRSIYGDDSTDQSSQENRRESKLREISDQIVFGSPIHYYSQTRRLYTNSEKGIYAFKVSPPEGLSSISVPSIFDAPGGFVYHVEDHTFLKDTGDGFSHVCTSTCTYYIYSPFAVMKRYD